MQGTKVAIDSRFKIVLEVFSVQALYRKKPH
jgi:hypothetical protein